MKKILMSVFITAFLVTGMKGQTPSYNMENWANVQFSTTQQDPVGWASFNILVAGGMQQTVYKETAFPYEATRSAKIVTKEVTVSVPGYDTVGLLVLGEIQVFPTQKITYGQNYTQRPATVTFATKYFPMGLDTGWVLVQLTKWNIAANKADTIASARFETSATDSLTWVSRTINLAPTYTNSTDLPDTLKIYCSSSSLYRPKINSTLWVDDFQFNGWVSTNDIDGTISNVSVYPNPANNNISIECSVTSNFVEVMDITGRKIGGYTMNANKVNIETMNFAKGMYIYQVIDNQNKIINRGKFEVAH